MIIRNWQNCIFQENSHLAKGAKNGPKKRFYVTLFNKFVIWFPENSRKWKIILLFAFISGKSFVLELLPKYFCPIRLQDSSKRKISRNNRVILLFFLHAVRHLWTTSEYVIIVWCGQACRGMPKVQIKCKSQISLWQVRWLCYFFLHPVEHPQKLQLDHVI